jgi:hypothetical protein
MARELAESRTELRMDQTSANLLEVLKNIPVFKPLIELATRSKDYQKLYVKMLNEEHTPSALEGLSAREQWIETRSSIKESLREILKQLCGWQSRTVDTFEETINRVVNQFDLLQSCPTSAATCFEKPKTQTILNITKSSDSIALQLFYILIQNSGIKSTKKEAIIRLTHKMLEYNEQSLKEASTSLLGKLSTKPITVEGNLDFFENYTEKEKDLLDKLSTEFITTKKKNHQDSLVITYLELQDKPTDITQLFKWWAEQKGLSDEDLEKLRDGTAPFDLIKHDELNTLFSDEKKALNEFATDLNQFITEELKALNATPFYEAIKRACETDETIEETYLQWKAREFSDKQDEQIKSLLELLKTTTTVTEAANLYPTERAIDPSPFREFIGEIAEEGSEYTNKPVIEAYNDWKDHLEHADRAMILDENMKSLEQALKSTKTKDVYNKLKTLSRSGHNSTSTLICTLLNISPRSTTPLITDFETVIEKLGRVELPNILAHETLNERIKHTIQFMSTFPGRLTLEEKAIIVFLYSENCIETHEDAGNYRFREHPLYADEQEAFLNYAESQLTLITVALKEYQSPGSSLADLLTRANTQSPSFQAQQERVLSATGLSGRFTEDQKTLLESTYHHPQSFSTWEILMSSIFLLLSTDDELTEDATTSQEHLNLEVNMIASCIALTGSIKAGSKTLESTGAASLNSFIRNLPKNYDFNTGALDVRGMAGDLIGEEKVKKTEHELLNKLPSAIHSFLIFSFAAMIFLAVSIPVFLVLLETSLFTVAQTTSLALLAGSSILMTSYYINKLLYHFSGTESHVQNVRSLLIPDNKPIKPHHRDPSVKPPINLDIRHDL